MTQDSEDRIAKVVQAAVTGEQAAVQERRRSSGVGGLRISTGLALLGLLLQLLAVAATAGGLYWKLTDMGVKMQEMGTRWERTAEKMEERIRAQEQFQAQTVPILELVKAKLGLDSGGRGGRLR